LSAAGKVVQRRGYIGMEIEDTVKPGQFQDASNRRLEGCQADISRTIPHPFEEVHQRGKPGTVDEVDAIEVDHEAPAPLSYQSVKHRLELPAVDGIELT
jgi:hypothetical protein